MRVIEVNSIEGLKAFEQISPKVSSKYVPIYSTELVETLAPEFTLVKAVKICDSSSMHYTDMISQEGDHIRFYNSFNRSLAFRMSLITSDGLIVGLGSDRITHIGKNAKNLIDDTVEYKKSIIESITNAKILAKTLKTENIKANLARVISDIIFKNIIEKKGFQGYGNLVDVLLEQDISITDYINKTIKNFLGGNYTYTVNGVKKIGRPNRSTYKKVIIETSLIKFLENEFPEYFI